jgi:hypothetical protein
MRDPNETDCLQDSLVYDASDRVTENRLFRAAAQNILCL